MRICRRRMFVVRVDINEIWRTVAARGELMTKSRARRRICAVMKRWGEVCENNRFNFLSIDLFYIVILYSKLWSGNLQCKIRNCVEKLEKLDPLSLYQHYTM